MPWIGYAKAKAKPQAKGLGLKGSQLLGGHGVRHLLTTCDICSKGILGPRFRCIHCPSYNACLKCESKLGSDTGAQGGRKRSLSAEGVLRGVKRGKYQFELSDGTGTLEVTPNEIQPLLTNKEAERLSAAGIFEAKS
eukprot:g33398.t1